MARGGIWQGIRDWLGPVERSSTLAGTGPDGLAGDACFEDPAFDDASVGEGVVGEGVDAVREEELLEFLATDLDSVPADPVFREQLREELWAMLVDRGFTRPDDS